ncbi:TPA: SGNH/GDSL hydrolase family protein, partial [Klebsiella pneumoniae]|nr:SGNH/GDSL hydrolase family protein [Klebsiella pneumoniae]HDK6042785.1 SGNH/GDSL hydrolase family protein [Klebsiella pneumoniae]
MAEFIPPLGTADPQIFMDNVRRLDQLMQSSELTFPDRAGELLYTWRGIHQTLIPLSKQYQTLEAAQADIANIPVNSFTYIRDPSGNALALEYQNVAGVLTATGRKMPSRSSMVIGIVDSWVNNNLYPFDSLSSPNENSVSMNVAAVSTIAYREAYSDLLSPVAAGDIITVRYKYSGTG